MFTSSGYFRDIICPFLKSGLCERPHCHYKHDIQYEVKASTSRLSSVPEVIPDYVPTPVSQLKAKSGQTSSETTKTSSVDSNKSKSKFKNIYQDIPEYKPTPISELKKQQINSYSDDESPSKKQKKEKNVTVPKSTIESKKKITDSQTKNKNQIKDKTKSETKLNKSTKTSDKSEKTEKKSEIVRKRSSDQSSGFESDSNEDLQYSQPRKKSFDEIIGLSDESREVSVSKKVRIAHQNTSNISPKKLEKKPLRPTPTQTMHQRYSIQTNKNETTVDNTIDTNLPSNAAKVRIAHKTVAANEPKVDKDCIGNSITGKKRIAHKPTAAKRPLLVGPVGNKLPLKLRQLYLNKFIDEYLQYCPEEEAYQRGLDSEKSIYDRSKSEQIYKVISVHEVQKIRTEAAAKQNSSPNKKAPTLEEMKKYGNPVVSHEAILNGKISGTFSIERKQKSLTVEELSDIELYKMLLKYVMTEKQLVDYGYPRPDPSKRGWAVLPKPESHKIKNNYDTRVRQCSRCQKIYSVDEFEMPLKKETCIYHFGRVWNERYNKTVQKTYSCCKNDIGSGGCSSNPYHIVDGFDRPDYCNNYIRTLPLKPAPQSGYYGIYGLDCEMCYTTHGLELTRVTVVNVKQQTIYETLVKPSNPILDYNSKFSGIKESDLKSVTTTIEDVQRRLQSLFNEKTILIGHSLESDLKALKIIHNTVVDTAQVFPHKRGLPFKRALRTLTAEFLKKIIQDDVDGHDSKEDATAALKLMLWKIGEDLKKYKR